MAIGYSTNWMGPINLDWIEKNGDNWSTGRIDVYGPWDYPDEIHLPPMDRQDWNRFSIWLEDIRTEAMLTLEQLVKQYEQTNEKITWLKRPEWEENV